MEVTKKLFGKLPTGEDVDVFTLTNNQGMAANIITYGATIQALSLHGKDIALGYDNLEGYLNNDGCLGATIGRVANRIKDGTFTLDGTKYQLALNNGGNTLHGGTVGFHQRLFTPTVDSEGLHLTYISPEGEEGFPGEVVFTVTYSMTEDNELTIAYAATTTAPTPFQVTNHSYFNLDLPQFKNATAEKPSALGTDTISVLNHTLKIAADAYDKNDETGVAQPSKRTNFADDPIFDFSSEKTIGRDIHKTSQQLQWAKGYDHAFVLSEDTKHGEAAATLSNGEMTLKVFTTMGYLHVYTGNYLDMAGKDGIYYGENAGVALEAEHEPNAINAEDLETREKAILTPAHPLQETITFQLLENK